MKKKLKVEEGNPFDEIHNIFDQHIAVKPHYLVGKTLWSLHTHVYKKTKINSKRVIFDKTPRLALLSPAEGSGKSTVLKILKEIVWSPQYIVDPRSTIYHFANVNSILIDEADNARLSSDLKAVLNAGYDVDGVVWRKVDGIMEPFPVFGPVALAGIGTFPPPLLSRCLVIHMHRAYGAKPRYIPNDNLGLKTRIMDWADKVELNPDPPMPPSVLKGRGADNWRVLIAIADSLGRGDIARKAAIEFTREEIPTNKRVELLHDTRIVWEETDVEILSNHALLHKLIKLEHGLGDWYKLTLTQMGHWLGDFEIKNKPMRYLDQLRRCYAREDFLPMWERYEIKSTKPSLKVIPGNKKEQK
jgi:hypothetical protein